MSIEQAINDLTEAIKANTESILKAISKSTSSDTAQVKTETVPAPPKKLADPETVPDPPKKLADPETVPDPPKKEEPPAPPAGVTPTPETAPMTAEELNAALVAEFNRLGDRAPIDAALKELGVTGVTELPADKYQILIDKVRAL